MTTSESEEEGTSVDTESTPVFWDVRILSAVNLPFRYPTNDVGSHSVHAAFEYRGQNYVGRMTLSSAASGSRERAAAITAYLLGSAAAGILVRVKVFQNKDLTEDTFFGNPMKTIDYFPRTS